MISGAFWRFERNSLKKRLCIETIIIKICRSFFIIAIKSGIHVLLKISADNVEELRITKRCSDD